jgi:hypothetical protein
MDMPTRIVLLCVALGLSLLAPPNAFAGLSVIDFEDLPGGTAVTNQYESRGVVFGSKPDGSPSGSLHVQSAPGRAQSGTQVGAISDGTPEFPASNVWGRLI